MGREKSVNKRMRTNVRPMLGAALFFAGVLLSGLSGCTVEEPKCDSNDQCRNGRICHQGQCAYPDEVDTQSGGAADTTSDATAG